MDNPRPAAATADTSTPTRPHPITTWEAGRNGDHVLVVAEPAPGHLLRRPTQGTAVVGHVRRTPGGRFTVHHDEWGTLDTCSSDGEARRALERQALEDRAAHVQALVAQAGADWARHFRLLSGYEPPAATDAADAWAYRVTRTHVTGELWTMSYGTEQLNQAETADVFAGRMATATRGAHHYDGEMIVTVWTRDDDDPARRPSRTGSAPADARTFAFGVGAGALDGEPAPLVDPVALYAAATRPPAKRAWAYVVFQGVTGQTITDGTREVEADAEPGLVAAMIALDERRVHKFDGGVVVFLWPRAAADGTHPADRDPKGFTTLPADAQCLPFREQRRGADDEIRERLRELSVEEIPGLVDLTPDQVRWLATSAGDTIPTRDPATDPDMEQVHFHGGPWNGQTRYVPTTYRRTHSAFVTAYGATWGPVLSEETETRPRYRALTTGSRPAMVWYDPAGRDVADVALTLATSSTPYADMAFSRIVERAREAGGIARHYNLDDADGMEHAISAASPGLTAAALLNLVPVMPGVTDAQMVWLHEIAARLDLAVVEDLTGANGAGDEQQEAGR